MRLAARAVTLCLGVLLLSAGPYGDGIGAAELGLGLPPGTWVSTLEPFTVSVSLQAYAVADSRYVRSSWLDEIEVSAVDADGRSLPVRVVSRRPIDSKVVKHESNPRGDGLLFSALLELEGFAAGRTTLSVQYQDLTRWLRFEVPNRTEAERTEYLRRRSGATAPKTYEEFRHEALRRIEEVPDDWLMLWRLAEATIRFGTEDDAERYLREAVAAQERFIQRMKEHEEPLKRAGLSDVEENLRLRDAMAKAAISVLPEYYANRDQLYLYFDWSFGSVDLQNRETRESVRHVRASAFMTVRPENK